MTGGAAVESRSGTARSSEERRCSSAAEQGSHKPRVGGSIPPTATKNSITCEAGLPGASPAASISPTIQYQLPILHATGAPRSHVSRWATPLILLRVEDDRVGLLPIDRNKYLLR